MGLPSKEERVLGLFFNEPSRHWHFKDIVKEAAISRQQAAKWLRRFIKENLILHIKEKGRMPYFIANFEHPNYRNRKKLFALSQLNDSGLLAHLQSLPKAKTVIIFGSFARSDWHKDSDLDLFILGNPKGFEPAKYWKKLKREVQPHFFQEKQELKSIRSGLLRNVIDGYLVKGSMKELL
ncbi:nucleotidyltransferase domain-containing protein [Candidatus Woesearchaeota archaeon]|nr:nucleotidyltransferase domain-containing protein [Candidatus Woesearchaeota archaeon]